MTVQYYLTRRVLDDPRTVPIAAEDYERVRRAKRRLLLKPKLDEAIRQQAVLPAEDALPTLRVKRGFIPPNGGEGTQ